MLDLRTILTKNLAEKVEEFCKFVHENPLPASKEIEDLIQKRIQDSKVENWSQEDRKEMWRNISILQESMGEWLNSGNNFDKKRNQFLAIQSSKNAGQFLRAFWLSLKWRM